MVCFSTSWYVNFKTTENCKTDKLMDSWKMNI